MPTFRSIRFLLIVLLSVVSGHVPDVRSAQGMTQRVIDLRKADAREAPTETIRWATNSGSAVPARDRQQRILFIVASRKVHGASTLPASISFGEVVQAWDTFQAAGYAVDFVSPDGGDVPILDAYVGDGMQSRLQDDRIMGSLRHTLAPEQVDPGRYRAVFYVGGSNAMYGVAENAALQDIAMHVYERNGGVVSAVCHGTAGIVNLKFANGLHLVSGKRISGYPEAHEDQDAAYFREFPFLIRKTIEARGGSFHAIESAAPHIEVDGRVVTGQNYASAKPVAEAVVGILRAQAEKTPDKALNNG